MQPPPDPADAAATTAASGWHAFPVTHQFAVLLNALETIAIVALLGSNWNTARFDIAYALFYGLIAALLTLNVVALTAWRARRAARRAAALANLLILLYVATVAVGVALAWAGGNPFGLLEALLSVLLALPPLFALAALRALARAPAHH